MSHRGGVSMMRCLRMNRSGDRRKSCHGRAGSTIGSWIAAKRTGSTVLQCSLFLFAHLFGILRASLFYFGVFMTLHLRVRQQLELLEALLRERQLWQTTIPQASAFESTQPFCMDTLEPFEWLQWVLIPRMHALLDSGQPLPQAFAVAPYYEMALDAAHPHRERVLLHLQQLDALFTGDGN